MSNFRTLKILDNLKGKLNTCWHLFIVLPSEFMAGIYAGCMYMYIHVSLKIVIISYKNQIKT